MKLPRVKILEEIYISATVVVHDNAPVLAEKLNSLNGALAGFFKYFPTTLASI
jgi:hypothetical protein